MSSHRSNGHSRTISINESLEEMEETQEKEIAQKKFVDRQFTPQQLFIINNKLPKLFSFQPIRKRYRRMVHQVQETSLRKKERRNQRNNNEVQAVLNVPCLLSKPKNMEDKEQIEIRDVDKAITQKLPKENEQEAVYTEVKYPQSPEKTEEKAEEIAYLQKVQASSEKIHTRSLSTNQQTPEAAASQNPKQSKSQPKQKSSTPQKQQKFRQQWRILKLLQEHSLADPFLTPVNEQLDGAIGYYKIIKDPIDLQTIQQKLRANRYLSSSQFHADIDKMWQNSYKFNKPKSGMHRLTKQLQRFHHNLMNISPSSPHLLPSRRNKKP